MEALNRRRFLTSLLGLAAAPLAIRALGGNSPDLPRSTDNQTLKPALGGYVQGRAILVPSNRIPGPGWQVGHVYVGPWDGTLKLERGCDNPAWVWFDLCKRAYPDRPKRLAAEIAVGITEDTKRGILDLRALADWGRWCDELVPDWMVMYDEGDLRMDGTVADAQDRGWPRPRFTLNTVCSTTEEMDGMRDNLRMRFLHWQSTDPRYRRSFAIKTRQCGRTLHVLT